MMAQYDYNPQRGARFDTDAWDGYVAARNRILGYFLKRRPSNPIVISGDMHSNWVADLKADFDEPSSATVGTVFVGTSITSTMATRWVKKYARALGDNPHVKLFDGRPGGYVRCDLTPERWRSDLRLVDSILDPRSPMRTFASFVVEDGRPGAVRV
jgi:alkaline phosphatase D